MPDLAWNQQMWDGAYNWEAGGEEWSVAWGGSEAQWIGSLYPRIRRFLPADRVLEIGPGCGRWTKFLLPHTNLQYVGIDLSQECVRRCRRVFRDVDKALFAVNDGLSLQAIRDESCDFVFSFDAMVYAEIDVLEAYIPQILTKLRPHGAAFIHHSNWRASGGSRANPHFRAESVSAEAVAEIVRASGGAVALQEVLNWDSPWGTDCFSLFGRADGLVGAPLGTLQNTRFMIEASIIREVQGLYSRLPADHAPLPGTSAKTVDRMLAVRARLEELEAQVHLQEVHRAQLLEDLAELRGQLTEVLGSNSWRLTAPLRAVMELARRIGRPGRTGMRSLRSSAPRALHRVEAEPPSASLPHHPGELGQPPPSDPPRADGGIGGDTSAMLAERGSPVVSEGERRARVAQPEGEATATGFRPSTRFRAVSRFEPEVTVIVPNYNHGPYLEQRLESVYGQSYRNFKVVLLDDGSTDNSRAILEAYRRKYASVTELVLNEVNGGSAFAQWHRGISRARGELIWIAESDDYCDERLLATLVPWFRDEAVQLTYGRTVFVGENGRPLAVTFESYVEELDAAKWEQSYVETAHNEIRQALGKKNTIPNVSGVVFRKPTHCRLLEERSWQALRLCGDWIFYLHVARGGKIAFSPATTNYHRYHGQNTTVRTYKSEDYYREHATVAATVARLYDTPPEVLTAHFNITKRVWLENTGGAAHEDDFSKVYDPREVKRAAGERRPNILMVGLAFSLGGGEIVPIRLATALKERGYGVTYFDFQGEPGHPAVRRMLGPDVPVIEHDESAGDLAEVLEEFGIEIVHTHNARTDLYFVAAMKRMGKKVCHVATLHGMYDAQDQLTVDSTLPFIATGVDAWAFVADKNLAPFVERGLYQPERFVKIANGMAPPPLKPVSREALGIPGNAFVVCVASRAVPEKGWREATEIAKLARELSGRDVHLVLLGDGPLKAELEAERLPQYVHLLGCQENSVDYYAMADLGLLPSRFRGESFPLSVMECLVAGRPVIASDVGEVRRMLTAADGQVAGGVVALADGALSIRPVAELVAAHARDRGRYDAAREVAVEVGKRFGLDRVIEAYEAIYERALRRKVGP